MQLKVSNLEKENHLLKSEVNTGKELNQIILAQQKQILLQQDLIQKQKEEIERFRKET